MNITKSENVIRIQNEDGFQLATAYLPELPTSTPKGEEIVPPEEGWLEWIKRNPIKVYSHECPFYPYYIRMPIGFNQEDILDILANHTKFVGYSIFDYVLPELSFRTLSSGIYAVSDYHKGIIGILRITDENVEFSSYEEDYASFVKPVDNFTINNKVYYPYIYLAIASAMGYRTEDIK